MPVLDFKEIAEAHIATGVQDTFELFARDFLEFLGYTILTPPARGADGGADIVVQETRSGVGGSTTIRWLVSCKHKAHSGASVTPKDEANISDRVHTRDCHGFIGFYSTLPSSGLLQIMEGAKRRLEIQVFDRARIEKELIHSGRGLEVAVRYFPNSIASWRQNHPEPARIFDNSPSLKCHVCGNELLHSQDKGVITFWQRIRSDFVQEPEYYEYIYWTCRGHCDRALTKAIRAERKALIDGWEDIRDVVIPTMFVKWVITLLNHLHSGKAQYSDKAFEQLKIFLLNVYPYACRHLTEEEKKRMSCLMVIPAYLGGLACEN